MTIRFPRPRELPLDLLAGAASGAVATFVMDRGFKLLSKLESQASKSPSKPPAPEERREPATEKVARKLMAPFGVHLEGERKRRAGKIVHWTYGTLWGAAFGAMHGRVPYANHLFGLTFGLGLFMLGDEVLVPILKLAPPPNQVPLRIHLNALLSHLLYGATAEGSFRLLRRANAG